MKLFNISTGYCVVDNGPNTLGGGTDADYAWAPDYVIEGWAFDPTLEGSARFIRVITPEVQRKTREYLYESDARIHYGLQYLTVDEANKLFSEYFAEGNEAIYSQLRTLIDNAKTAIREEYPDEVNS